LFKVDVFRKSYDMFNVMQKHFKSLKQLLCWLENHPNRAVLHYQKCVHIAENTEIAVVVTSSIHILLQKVIQPESTWIIPRKTQKL